VKHIRATVETDVQGEWICIGEQLNTHQSESLVRALTELCALELELGKKGHAGILRNMTSRAAFLPDDRHRIRWVYTPKPCSWLNQVEMWFAILTRRLLKRGNFKSTEQLKQRILAFIECFNQTHAKPFRWNYIGKPLLT
jgi:transposase